MMEFELFPSIITSSAVPIPCKVIFLSILMPDSIYVPGVRYIVSLSLTLFTVSCMDIVLSMVTFSALTYGIIRMHKNINSIKPLLIVLTSF